MPTIASAPPATVKVGPPDRQIDGVVVASVDAMIETLLGLVRNADGTVGDRWLFRGQRSERFVLIPNALRGDSFLLEPDGKWVKGLGSTEWEQVRREMTTVHSFCRIADSAGQALPEDSQQLRQVFNRWVWSDDTIEKLQAGEWEWPPDELLSICGLAQHYGLPTRLLDWTYDPLVAAYFAVESAARAQDAEAKYIVVWALSDDVLHVDRVFEANRAKRAERAGPRIVRVTAPAASNANLRAQKGLFLLVRPGPVDPHKAAQVHTVSDVIAGMPDTANRQTPLQAFLLDVSEAPRMLRALASHFVSAATVTPDVRGSVNGLLERRLWPKDPSAKKEIVD